MKREVRVTFTDMRPLFMLAGDVFDAEEQEWRPAGIFVWKDRGDHIWVIDVRTLEPAVSLKFLTRFRQLYRGRKMSFLAADDNAEMMRLARLLGAKRSGHTFTVTI